MKFLSSSSDSYLALKTDNFAHSLNCEKEKLLVEWIVSRMNCEQWVKLSVLQSCIQITRSHSRFQKNYDFFLKNKENYNSKAVFQWAALSYIKIHDNKSNPLPNIFQRNVCDILGESVNVAQQAEALKIPVALYNKIVVIRKENANNLEFSNQIKGWVSSPLSNTALIFL